MLKRFTTTILFLAALAAITSAVSADDDKPPFTITTKRDNDKVEVKVEKDKTVFVVRSPFGISQAVIERTGDKWPEAVTLRLHLKGLESFRATNGKVTLDAAVSSNNAKVRLWKDGKEETPLDPKSPYWMEIHMVGGDGKPDKAIPLKDGHFEMALPRAFFEGNPKAITVNWIDFYRN